MNRSSQLRMRVLGIPVDPMTMPAAIERVDEHLQVGTTQLTVLAVNPEKVYAIRSSEFLRNFFEGGGLLIPDGIGVVLSLRMQGVKSARVAGADLMPEICRLAATKGYRVFVFGSRDEVNRDACEKLRARFPELRIVGRSSGYVPLSEEESLVAAINESGAEILFVALGSPRQEEWMSRNLQRLPNVKVCQGIGGTLDTITGEVKRAPTLFRRLHLEWFYRLMRQPTRIGRQTKLALFAWEVGGEQLSRVLRTVVGARG